MRRQFMEINMKLVNRERVDGTNITIGKRVYYRNKKANTARGYSAEYIYC